MGLETGTYISDLVATNPVGATDPKSAGDDHIRLLKSTILATFPSVTGAVTATHTELNYLAGFANEFDITSTLLDCNAVTADFDGTTFTADYTTITLTGGSAVVTVSGTEIDLTATTLDFNGAADFSSTVTAAGALSSTKTYALDAAGLVLNAGLPAIQFTESDGSTNNKRWLMFCEGEQFRIATLTDAGSSTDFMTVDRTAGVVDEIEFNATLFDFNGAADFSGTVAIAGVTTLTNYLSLNSNGYLRVDISNTLALQNGSSGFALRKSDNTSTLVAIDDSGALTTLNASASEVGYKGLPQNSKAVDYTLVLTDAGKHLIMTATAKTFTIPANASVAFPIGTVISFAVNAGGSTSIAITTDALYLAGTAFGTSGTRTLADGGMATALKITSTAWLISGVGLS